VEGEVWTVHPWSESSPRGETPLEEGEENGVNQE
jgi:hypothetical protein